MNTPEYNQMYKQKNRERIKLQTQMYGQKNRERIKLQRQIYRDSNKEQIKKEEAIYRLENADKIKVKDDRYKRENPYKVRKSNRKSHLKTKYGITLNNYDDMVIKQNGLCAICHKPEMRKNHSLSVDHDHSTGQIRELLCDKCNKALGFLNDNSDLVRNAAAYLDKHNNFKNN